MYLRIRLLRRLTVATLSLFLLALTGLGTAAPPEKKGKNKNKTPDKAPPAPAKVAPPPAGAKIDALTLAQHIDRAINKRLKEENVAASPLADDAEFLRRIYLDITGHIPPADKAAAFLDSKEADKRARLIDELLASPEYGRHLADIWDRLLIPRNNTENRLLTHEPLTKWLVEHFNQNVPWNKTVHDLLTADGAQDKNGAVTFFLGNASVDKMTDAASKLFLGVQLQCAQCHNHPFTDWKQADYWGMAAFFLKVDPMPVQMANRQGVSPKVEERENPRRLRNPLPESAKILPPKFLAGQAPKVPATGPVRHVLADWLTTARNPYFSKATVNRVWGQYFGRGLVNPVDDMQEGNAPSHPELLQELARQFGNNGFDLKYLVRAICNSQTYQRSSKPAANAEAAPYLLSHMTIKVMSPEQLYDSLGEVLGYPNPGAEGPRRGPMGQPLNPRNVFITFFGVEDADVTEYQTGIPQALNLMNSPRINNAVQNSPLVRSTKPVPEVIEQLYLATVSRRPTAKELSRLTEYVKKSAESAKGYGDILWALLNSSEFVMNH